jgi:hypothetical protein
MSSSLSLNVESKPARTITGAGFIPGFGLGAAEFPEAGPVEKSPISSSWIEALHACDLLLHHDPRLGRIPQSRR